MSVDALSWAFRAHVLPMEKLVLLALADRASEFGDCYPSARDIVTRTGLTDRSVRRILHSLAQRGLLSVETRSRDNGATTSNRYLLHVGLDATVKLRPRAETEPAHEVAEAPPESSPPLTQTTAPPLTQEGSPPGLTGGGIMNRQDRTVRKEDSAATRAREALKTAKAPSVPLPADWQPTADDIAYAHQVGINPETVLRDFRAYWSRVTGAKGRSNNWSLAWVGWVRREARYATGSAAPALPLSSAPTTSTATNHPGRGDVTGPALPDPRLAMVPEDMRRQVEERLNAIESRPIWTWAMSQPGLRFVWDETGAIRTPGFTLGRGILNRVIVEAASAAQLLAVGRRDCEMVAHWLTLTEHAGDAADIAIRTVTAMRARWRSDTPPFSLVPFDADVQRAAAAWNAARAERMQRRTTADKPDQEVTNVE